MATTSLAAASQVQKWMSTYFAEYVRNSGFSPYMGTGTGSVIQVKRELVSGGKTINIPLVTRLKGAGITGINTLEGNEEALGNYNQAIAIDWLRHAVRVTKPDQHYSEYDLLQASRDMLTTWASDTLRTAIITALGGINGVAYGTASAAQRNTWTAANSDRILFGRTVSNYSATHATALLNVDSTETLSAGTVSLAKRLAKNADPHIRPMRTSDGREYFVMFVGSMAFRDIKADATMSAANREARPRDVESNPIFQDGDLIYDGVIIREIPEIPATGTVGASSARVEPYYLCGAQSVAIAWGQEPKSIKDEFDYGQKVGIGTEEARGVEKLRFETGSSSALKDHGVLTGFIAAAADA